MAVNPTAKQTNMSASVQRVEVRAPRNSRQMRMPQTAEINVFPSPRANEIAGPTVETHEAAKFATVPTVQIAPAIHPSAWRRNPSSK